MRNNVLHSLPLAGLTRQRSQDFWRVFDSGLFPQPDGPPLLPSLHPKGRPT